MGNKIYALCPKCGSEKLDSQEIFEEIISLLHCYSMKLYSSRKAKKIKEILEEDDSTES